MLMKFSGVRIHQFFLVVLSSMVVSFSSFSQRAAADSAIGATWLGIHYGANLSGGDLADRYGFLNHLGIIAGRKTKKNYVFGTRRSVYFWK